MQNVFSRGMLLDITDSSATHSPNYVVRSNTSYAICQGRREIGEFYSGIRLYCNLFVGLYIMGVEYGENFFFRMFSSVLIHKLIYVID